MISRRSYFVALEDITIEFFYWTWQSFCFLCFIQLEKSETIAAAEEIAGEHSNQPVQQSIYQSFNCLPCWFPPPYCEGVILVTQSPGLRAVSQCLKMWICYGGSWGGKNLLGGKLSLWRVATLVLGSPDERGQVFPWTDSKTFDPRRPQQRQLVLLVDRWSPQRQERDGMVFPGFPQGSNLKCWVLRRQ